MKTRKKIDVDSLTHDQLNNINSFLVDHSKNKPPQFILIPEDEYFKILGFEPYKFLGIIPVYKSRANEYAGQWSWLPMLFGKTRVTLESKKEKS